MNKALVEHDYLVGNKFTIADIALYAYTHVAEEKYFRFKVIPKYPRMVSTNSKMSKICE